MKTEEIKLSQITENAGNPRTITEEKFKKLVKSILVFPRMLSLRPIVVDSQMNVLGGNMRLRALKHIVTMDKDTLRFTIANDETSKFTKGEADALIGYWMDWRKSPVVSIINANDLTERQKKEFVIKDNVGFGDWDTNMLANEWDTDALKDWGMEDWQLEGKNPTEEENGGQMIILIITTRERLSLLSTSRRMGISPSVTATIPARQILSFLQLRILRIWTRQLKHS